MNKFNVTFTLTPTFDVAKFNTILSSFKKSLGEHGKDIKLIDEKAVNDALRGAQTGAKQVGVELEKTAVKGKKAGETIKGSFGKALQFSGVIYSVQAITGAFERFIGPYKEFDKQLRNIGTLGVKNFEEFRNKAIDLASEVPDTVAGVTNSIYNAISAGAIEVVDGVADIEGGMKLVEQASKLSVAGLTDTNSAVKSLASNLNAYGESMDQAGRYSDILFNTVNNGVTTIPELNASLSNVVPTAAAFGVGFEQVTAAIAVMTKQGVPTAQATTKIRSALVELSKPGANLKKIMDAAGVSLASLKQEGLQVTFAKLGDAMDAAGVSANQVFSRVEGATAALALSGKNAKSFADILATYTTDAVGSTQRAFDIANEGIGVGVQGVMNKIEAAFFKVFNVVGDGFTSTLALANQIAPLAVSFAAIGQVMPTGAIKGLAMSMFQFLVPAMVTTEAETGKLIFAKNALTFATLKARAAQIKEMITAKISHAVRTIELNATFQLAAARQFLNGLTLKGIVTSIAHNAVLAAKAVVLGVVTAAQWLWNAAMSANPIGAVIVAIGAFIAISKVLSDALHQTAAERLEELKSEDALLDKQIQNIQVQKQKIKSNQDLVKSYEELGNNLNRSAEEEARFRNVQIELSKTYPGAIKWGNTFAENLGNVKKAAGDTGATIESLNTKIQSLKGKKIDLSIEISKTQIAKDFEDIQDLIAGQGNVLNIAADFVFGTSTIRQNAEAAMQTYKDEIYKATSQEDIQGAVQRMQIELWDSEGKFAELSPETRLKISEYYDKIGKDAGTKLVKEQEKMANEVKSAVNYALKEGVSIAPETVKRIAEKTGRPIEEVKNSLVDAFAASADAGNITTQAIEGLAANLGITNEETKKLVLEKILANAAKQGGLTETQIGKLAEQFGKSKDEVREMLALQKQQTDEAKRTAEAAKSIGEAYAANIKGMKEKYQKDIAELAALTAKSNKEGLSEEEKQQKRQLEIRLQQTATELKDADKINKELAEKYKITSEKQSGAKAKTVKKIKDYSAKILEIEKKNEELRQKLALNSISDEDERARRELELTQKKNEDKIQDEINTLQKKKNLSDGEVKLVEQYNIKLNLIRQQNSIEMYNFEINLAQKQLEERKKIAEQEEQNSLEASRLQLELMQSTQTTLTSSDALINSLEEQHQLRLSIIRSEGQQQIQEVLNNNTAYQKAEENRLDIQAQVIAKEKQVNMLRASGVPAILIEQAVTELNALRDNLQAANNDVKEIENEVKDSDLVKNITLSVGIKEDESNKDTADKIRIANLSAITNTAVRERELKIYEAEKTYASELALAKDNEGLKYEAFIKFQTAKMQTEQEYLAQSSNLIDITQESLQSAMQTLGQSLMNTTVNPVQDAISKIKTQLEELRQLQNDGSEVDRIKEEEKALFGSLKKRSISTQEYYKNVNKLDKERRDAEAKRAKSVNDLVLRMQLGMATAFSAMQQSFNTKAQKDAETVSVQISANLDKLKEDGKEGTATLGEIFEGTTDAMGSYAKNAVGSSIAAFGAMLAAGENIGVAFRKGLLKDLLDTAEKTILTYIPQIYAAFFGWMGPWGFAAATGAIGLVYAGLEVAKSAIGAFRGVVDIEGPGTETSDSIPARLSKRESVLTAGATKAGENKELFTWLNKTKKPAFEFYLTERPDIVKSLVQDVVIQEMSLIKSQKEKIGNVLVMTGANSNRELIEKMDEQNNEIREMKKLIADGNYKRKTINRVDVGIDVSDKELIKRINIDKKARLRRL